MQLEYFGAYATVEVFGGGLTRWGSSRRMVAVTVRLAALVMLVKSVVQQAARMKDSGGWVVVKTVNSCVQGGDGRRKWRKRSPYVRFR